MPRESSSDPYIVVIRSALTTSRCSCALHRGVPLGASAIRDVLPKKHDGQHALHPIHSRGPIKVWVDRQRWFFQPPQFCVGNQFPVRAEPASIGLRISAGPVNCHVE
jgi:hypothetical protein